MLQLYGIPGDERYQEYGKHFINERLVLLVEDVIRDYAQMCDDSYMDRITDSSDWEKPLEEIIDLERLSHDEKFFSDWLDAYALTPRTVGPQRAINDFFSLYRLLKAKKEYKPDLTMEYILYAIIHNELDSCKDDPELHERIKRIPEPERGQMMAELLAEAASLKRDDPETWEEDIPEIAEDLISYYEDLDRYISTCFEDGDCYFLDDMDEDEIEDSGFADSFGVNVRGDEASVRIEGNGQNVEYSIRAWELE